MIDVSSKIKNETDRLFENTYEYTYDSQFLPKETCRKCFDTALQMGHTTDEEVVWRYEDIINLVIDILGIERKQ